MGILPRVRELLVPEKGLRYVDRDGRELATMPADLFTGDGSPVTELEIMKGDLTVIPVSYTHLTLPTKRIV